MVRIGVIGFGYWGPNILRNFSSLESVEVKYVCDLNEGALKRAQSAYPGVDLTTCSRDITRAADVDAVAIITPVATHYELAREALENGKHVFVEKPFTYTVDEAKRLIDIAEKKSLRIMIDHTFLFTGAVRKIKQLINDEGALGDLYYFDSTRVNLGLFQHDVNVVWDLAPHDLSIMDYPIPARPTAVIATGVAHYNQRSR